MPYTKEEALERFFLVVYPEARNALEWYKTTGMKPASPPRIPRQVARDIVQAAENFGIEVQWVDGTWEVVPASTQIPAQAGEGTQE